MNPTLDCKSAYGALSKYGVKNEKRKLKAWMLVYDVSETVVM